MLVRATAGRYADPDGVAIDRSASMNAIRPVSPDLSSYDTILLALSGGKDGMASLCLLLDAGVDPARIELWHHDVDG